MATLASSGSILTATPSPRFSIPFLGDTAEDHPPSHEESNEQAGTVPETPITPVPYPYQQWQFLNSGSF